jgi:alpha-beta hydrolase superfamily lysophospholipase
MEFIEKYDALFTAKNEYPGSALRADQTLADLPVSYLVLDHYGQGGSKAGTLPGHVGSYDTFVADVEKLVTPFLEITRPKSFLVMGHSMGGLIAARFAERNAAKIDGVVLSSPLFGVQAPPGVSPELLQQLVMAYATPAPYGFGLADRCSTALPPTALGGIAQCLTNEGCRSCFQAPVADPNSIPACSGIFPAETWTALRAGWQFLQSPASIGCKVNPDLEAAKAGCVLGTPAYNGLTTDRSYCEFAVTHPMRGPSQTFGWISASYAAIGAANAERANLTMPTLLLHSTIDPIANPAAMTTFCGAAPNCTIKTYGPPVTSELWFHELLIETKRELPIGEIRGFINARISK